MPVDQSSAFNAVMFGSRHDNLIIPSFIIDYIFYELKKPADAWLLYCLMWRQMVLQQSNTIKYNNEQAREVMGCSGERITKARVCLRDIYLIENMTKGRIKINNPLHLWENVIYPDICIRMKKEARRIANARI